MPVRLSEWAETGPGEPDVLGLAPRLPTATGDWDLVLSSTGERTRVPPMFVRHRQDARLGTLAPYRHRGELARFMAAPGEGEPPERSTLPVSGKDADWRPGGRGTGAAPLAEVRDEACEGSRRGRRES